MSLGESAWFYDGAKTVRVGLFGNEHTMADGKQTSRADFLNEAGQLCGLSERFNGGTAGLGLSAWFYDGIESKDIGLTGNTFTRNDGYRYNRPVALNSLGQVLGTSERYNGGPTQLGYTRWIYDSSLDRTFGLEFSTRSDGYAYSGVDYFGDDGVVLGTYMFFDASDRVQWRAFYFRVGEGAFDLGSLVNGGLVANGWDHLSDAIRANGLGQIPGAGFRNAPGLGRMAFLLVPNVPEPGPVPVAATVILMLFARIRVRF